LGFDFPELETVIIARPTMSLALYYQMIGRSIRIHPNKSTAWIVDLCDNYRKFGRVEDLKLTAPKSELWHIESKGRQLTNKYFGEIPHYRRVGHKSQISENNGGNSLDFAPPECRVAPPENEELGLNA